MILHRIKFIQSFVCGAVILIASSGRATSIKGSLTFGVSATYDAPVFLKDSSSGDVSGIAVDIVNHIAKYLSVQGKVVDLPRSRLEKALLDGEIDLICFSNPSWTKTPKMFKWSKPIIQSQDYIVRNMNAPPIKNVNELKNQSVGAVAGYYYDKMGPLFSDKKVQRTDFFDSNGMLKRLELGQIHYGILNRFFLEYNGINVKSSEDVSQKTLGSHLVVSTGIIDADNKIYCRIPTNSQIDMKKINKAIEHFHLKSYFREKKAR